MFIALLFASIGLAYLIPWVGADYEPFGLGDVAAWGVMFIFFFYGLRLSREKLKAGLVNTRLHMLVHISTFLLFPVLLLAVMKLCGAMDGEGDVHYLWIGSFFLATLPSTVSSSVVMVSLAGGNLPAAIFNASVSSLLGIFITPLWMSIFLDNIDGAHGLGDVVFKLIVQVLIPVCAGAALNPKYGAFAERHKKALRNFDQTIILLIVFTSFCDSFEKKMFSGFPLVDIAILSASMIILFFAVYFIIYALCHLMKFNREDTITALFCGSKKSLVHGTVMSNVLFNNPAVIGVILLPTMLYHAFQLLIVSVIAKEMGKNTKKQT